MVWAMGRARAIGWVRAIGGDESDWVRAIGMGKWWVRAIGPLRGDWVGGAIRRMMDLAGVGMAWMWVERIE